MQVSASFFTEEHPEHLRFHFCCTERRIGMDKESIEKLEDKFDRKLTEGEAAEIEHTEVLHADDEALYEMEEGEEVAPLALHSMIHNGR
jgi:hypothetical protein